MKVKTYIKRRDGSIADCIVIEPELIPEVGERWSFKRSKNHYLILSKITDLTKNPAVFEIFVEIIETNFLREIWVVRTAFATAIMCLLFYVLTIGKPFAGTALLITLLATKVVVVYIIRRIRIDQNSME